MEASTISSMTLAVVGVAGGDCSTIGVADVAVQDVDVATVVAALP